MKYLTLEDVLFIHKKLIDEYGGSHGIRDQHLLESALNRPKTTVFGEDAFKNLDSKIAVLCHSIVKNHPFVDGNKRTGFASLHMMLMLNGYDLTASNDEVIKFGLGVPKGDLDEKNITSWIKAFKIDL